MTQVDFAVVGSGAGGGTIAWLLARAGFDVVLLEQGTDWAKPLDGERGRYVPISHDEYRFRIERPEFKRRLRGDYNTYRASIGEDAIPFGGGWTGSQLGGGSVLWGGWGFRALPIDFVLETHFRSTGQLRRLQDWGYAVADWPVTYADMEPYFDVAETLFSVCGDREATNAAVAASGWFRHFGGQGHFAGAGDWASKFPFPQARYPQVPSGEVVWQGMADCGMRPVPAPSSMVLPGSEGYQTRAALGLAMAAWPRKVPEFWSAAASDLWSDRVRDACTMCGFCGEYLCWSRNGAKSGTRSTTLRELDDLKNARVVLDAKAYEVVYDQRLRRASGVRYLDLTDPDHPVPRHLSARHIVVSCGAIQSARLLLLSGPPGGLGNRFGQIGRNVTFHCFGLGATCELPEAFQGTLRGELGHTGNTASFEHYFLEDEKGEWWKGGIVVSAARKNPLEGAIRSFGRGDSQVELLDAMENYARTVEIRLTGDDLPMPANQVDLDPNHVDEHGLPVARISRNYGEAERLMFRFAEPKLKEVFKPFATFPNGDKSRISSKGGDVKLFSDHQMGTCRMGRDPRASVLDEHCRLHEVPNVFVVDSSFMPTGLGVNPMLTVVANALRVGTWIVENARRGHDLS